MRWAGSYQRRSPHALINVLWARQLEAAELRRATVSISEFVMNRQLVLGGRATAKVVLALHAQHPGGAGGGTEKRER